MNFKLKIQPRDVKGFNFHPSYSTGSLEDWIMFDYDVWKKELKNGKKLFPKMNTVRIWLSWNAFCRLEDEFIAEVRKVIDLCKELDLCVIPCLFNRWHDPMVDCDGIYIDHFLPGSSWLLKFDRGNCSGDCKNCEYEMDPSISRNELAEVFTTTESVIFNWEIGIKNN